MGRRGLANMNVMFLPLLRGVAESRWIRFKMLQVNSAPHLNWRCHLPLLLIFLSHLLGCLFIAPLKLATKALEVLGSKFSQEFKAKETSCR